MPTIQCHESSCKKTFHRSNGVDAYDFAKRHAKSHGAASQHSPTLRADGHFGPIVTIIREA